MMKIRSVQMKDVPRLLEIYSHYVFNTHISFDLEPPTLVEFQEKVSGITKKFPWLVCEVDGTIAGYAYGSTHRTKCAYEWSVESTIYLDPDFHGKGIGKKLYSELFALLKEQGAVNVFAGVAQPNEASTRLHLSVGFLPIGSFKDIGFKQDKWIDVDWFQLQLQKPDKPLPFSVPRRIS